MNDFESKLKTLLNERVDAQVGSPRTPPPFAAPSAARRAQRRWFGGDRAPWVLPLLAAACVAAVVAGTLGATHLLADSHHARPAVTPHPTAPPALSIVAGNLGDGAPRPGPATTSPLGAAYGVAVDGNGNVYIADGLNHVVEKVTPGGSLSIVAGTGKGGAARPGPATASPLAAPDGVAVDGNGNVYIADAANHVVEKVTPGGDLSIVAGTGKRGTARQGPATRSPVDPTDVAVDGSGSLFIADGANYLVEKVTPGGDLSIVAGTGQNEAFLPGLTAYSPVAPASVAVDRDGNLYIADGEYSAVAKATPAGALTVVAGNGDGEDPPRPGLATKSPLVPRDVAVDGSGNLYIADTGNHVVERVSPDGSLSIVAGNGTYGAARPGAPTDSPLDPVSVAVDGSGNLYIGNADAPTVVTVSGLQTTSPSTTPTSTEPSTPHTTTSSPPSYTPSTTPVANREPGTHIVHAVGATLVLPDGWKVTGPAWHQAFHRGVCIGRAHDKAFPCPIEFASLQDGAAVDDTTLGSGDLPTLCGGGPVDKKWQAENRTLGGREADWRSWQFSCSTTGTTLLFEHYMVATMPQFALELAVGSVVGTPSPSRADVAALETALDAIARDSALPAQTAALRLVDTGRITSVQRAGDAVMITLERYAAGDPSDKDLHESITYVVPVPVVDAAGAIGVGGHVQVQTDGTTVFHIAEAP